MIILWEKKLKAALLNMERNMLGITFKDRMTNKWVREQTKTQDILKIAKERKWKWAGHIGRRSDNRWTTAVTAWRPMTGNRNRGRQCKRWRDDLDRYWGTVNWFNKARDRVTWQSHTEAFVQRWTDDS